MEKLIAQFMKFGVVGVIAFVIDYGLMVALTELVGVNYLISATISFTVGRLQPPGLHALRVHAQAGALASGVSAVIGLGVKKLMWLGSSVLGVSYLIVKISPSTMASWWRYRAGYQRHDLLHGVG